MTTQKRTVIYVSDGTGITAETLGHGLLAQFEGIEFRPVRYPFVDSEDKVRDCLARINELSRREGVRPIVILTQTNPEFGAILHQAEAFFIDLFDAFIAPLEQELGCKYTRAMGRSHGQANPEYNARIAAMNFALAHDDGVSDSDLKSADIILVGVSRVGKTPDQPVSFLAVLAEGRELSADPGRFRAGCPAVEIAAIPRQAVRPDHRTRSVAAHTLRTPSEQQVFLAGELPL